MIGALPLASAPIATTPVAAVVTFVNATSGRAVATSISASVPSGTADGDQLLLIVVCTNPETITTPSGWTLMSGFPIAVGTGTWQTTYAFKREALSEPASYTVNTSASNSISYGMMTFRGASGFGNSSGDFVQGTSNAAPSIVLTQNSSLVSIWTWYSFDTLTPPSQGLQILNEATSPYWGVYARHEDLRPSGNSSPLTATTTNGTYYLTALAVEVLADTGSGSSYSESITESAAAGESSTTTLIAVGSRTESVAASEAQTAQADFVNSRTETAGATETGVGALIMPATREESAGAGDSAIGGLSFTNAITESVSATDTQSNTLVAVAAITETTGATETQAGVLIAVASRTEAVAATASETNTLILVAAVTETAAASDAGSVGGLSESITETVIATDFAVAVLVLAGSVTETASAAAEQVASLLQSVGVTESAGAAATQVATLTLSEARTESLSASDAQTSIATFVNLIVESVSSTDTLGTVMLMHNSHTESVIADSSALGSLLTLFLYNTIEVGEVNGNVARLTSTKTEVLLESSVTEAEIIRLTPTGA